MDKMEMSMTEMSMTIEVKFRIIFLMMICGIQLLNH